jgi:peptidoglycan/LPS O-acetylase OafA/YrhL
VPKAAKDAFNFRGDLQGLRAIAVIFVLLFHAEIVGFQGGFIGVDIFFVLSGFLITKNLLDEEIRTGTISISAFYAKRLRRLLPASVLVLISTLILGYFYLPPVLIPDLTRDVSAATLYISNFSFAARATDYFAANATPSPVLHFWSLSLEEQFYIFWPITVLLLSRTRFLARSTVRTFSAITLIASLFFAVWLLPKSEPWAFFSLPTRAWQLALGALVATLVVKLEKLNFKVAWLLSLIGLGAVLASGLFIRSAANFPGWIALLPTVGAALVIVGGTQHRKTFTWNLLNLPVMQYIGKISYSLYLWHWPLFVIPMISVGHALSLSSKLILIAITFALSILTEKFVEAKFRFGFLKRRKPMLTFFTSVLAMLVLISTSVGVRAEILNSSHHSGSSKPLTLALSTSATRPKTIDTKVPEDLAPSLFQAKNDHPAIYSDHCNVQVNQLPTSAACIYGDTTSATTVALFGDSHAMAWFPALNEISIKNHWKLYSQTMSACGPPDLKQWNNSAAIIMENCPIWREAAIKRIIKAKPLFVLVTGTRAFAAVHDDGSIAKASENAGLWEPAMKRTLEKFKTAGIKVIMVSDVPYASGDPVICLSAHPNSSLACTSPVGTAIDASWLDLERKVATFEKVSLIEPQMWVCPSDPCPVIIGNILIYLDGGHMTATFAAKLSAKLDLAIASALST